MHSPKMRKTWTAWVLAAVLLAAPALPVHAAEGPAAGFFGWLDAWVHHVTAWLPGDASPRLDAAEATASADDSTPATPLVPLDPDGGTMSSTEGDGDGGAQMDPGG